MKRGRFITLEGGDGSGKSTLINVLATHIQEQDRSKSVVVTADPGGGDTIAGMIRAILLNKDHDIDNTTELLLYIAARMQIITKIIRPNLDQGHDVLCDRFLDSTRVYQGNVRGMGMENIEWLEGLINVFPNAVPDGIGLYPDITFLIDVDPKVGLARSMHKHGQSQGPDETRWENEDLSVHEQIRAGYWNLVECEPERFVVIETTNRTKEESAQAIIEAYEDKINGR